MKELTKEDLAEYKENHYLTVGKLRKSLENVPDDSIVLVERIEDKYFENNNEGVYPIEGQFCYFAKKYNEDVKNGEWGTHLYHDTYTDEQISSFQEQFVPAWSSSKYHKDENEIFLIHMHY
ncbi:hypothetical protein M0P65_07675 [Candidatus Gracilibacteria bacterium]|jgi:hypothetical protein|nr:hypothetical protein [Candidatus Gracilibacteria bacterium]